MRENVGQPYVISFNYAVNFTVYDSHKRVPFVLIYDYILSLNCLKVLMKSIIITTFCLIFLTSCALVNKESLTAASRSMPPTQVVENSKVVQIAANHSLSSDRGTGFGVYNQSANKTWVTWAGENMNAYVREYDHTANNWSDSKIIGQIPYTDFFQYGWSEQKEDHHNYPKMTQLKDGKLLVIYSAHNSRLYKSISPVPNTVKGWDRSDHQEIKNGSDAIHATYPLVNTSSNGDVYVFYRYTTGYPTDYRPLEMIKSSDNGLTFSQPTRVIDTHDAMPDNLNEVYNDGFRHEPAHADIAERFLVGWTMAGGGPVNDHNEYHKNVYFAYFYPETDSWTDVKGTNLGTSIDEHEISHCLVFNSGDIDRKNKQAIDYYFAASYTDMGEPVLLFTHVKHGIKTFSSARWNGSEWLVVDITKGLSLMELQKVGADDFIAYQKAGAKIMAYKTTDGALSWSLDHVIDTHIKNLNKVGLIENYHPEVKFLGLQADWKERDTTGKYKVYIIKE